MILWERTISGLSGIFSQKSRQMWIGRTHTLTCAGDYRYLHSFLFFFLAGNLISVWTLQCWCAVPDFLVKFIHSNFFLKNNIFWNKLFRWGKTAVGEGLYLKSDREIIPRQLLDPKKRRMLIRWVEHRTLSEHFLFQILETIVSWFLYFFTKSRGSRNFFKIQKLPGKWKLQSRSIGFRFCVCNI